MGAGCPVDAQRARLSGPQGCAGGPKTTPHLQHSGWRHHPQPSIRTCVRTNSERYLPPIHARRISTGLQHRWQAVARHPRLCRRLSWQLRLKMFATNFNLNCWNRVNETKLIRRRLADADGLPAVLAAGWVIFELIATIASASADESPDMYAAFTFARGAAVSGRNAIAFAPSMPPISAGAGHELPKPSGDADEIADDLAGLASALSMRLRASAELAADAADRSACENAAGDAGQITWFLAQGN
jgi:hypothetical protein